MCNLSWLKQILTFGTEAQGRVFVVVVDGAVVVDQAEIRLEFVGGNLWGLVPLESWAGATGFRNDLHFYGSSGNVRIEDLEKKYLRIVQ